MAWLAAVVAVTAAVAHAASSARPALRLVSVSPFTVRGQHFHPHERVIVTLTTKGRWVRRVRASATGAFVVGFGRVPIKRCVSWAVVAIGLRGSRATLRSPPVLCPPPP
jgi:uncharacterized membrane protein YedE/YeeE